MHIRIVVNHPIFGVTQAPSHNIPHTHIAEIPMPFLQLRCGNRKYLVPEGWCEDSNTAVCCEVKGEP